MSEQQTSLGELLNSVWVGMHANVMIDMVITANYKHVQSTPWYCAIQATPWHPVSHTLILTIICVDPLHTLIPTITCPVFCGLGPHPDTYVMSAIPSSLLWIRSSPWHSLIATTFPPSLQVLLTPSMLTRSLLAQHRRWMSTPGLWLVMVMHPAKTERGSSVLSVHLPRLLDGLESIVPM